jgi:hypothetical protein
MKILVFVLGSLFGAYCSATVIKLAHNTVDFTLACCHIVVGAL